MNITLPHTLSVESTKKYSSLNTKKYSSESLYLTPLVNKVNKVIVVVKVFGCSVRPPFGSSPVDSRTNSHKSVGCVYFQNNKKGESREGDTSGMGRLE